ncbi:MAG TPA: CoA transferase [Dehalococcoidia bacterium]
MTLPLEGIRIIDLGWIIAGPLSTRLLADFGAEVIKVESSVRPDVARGNRSPLFGELPGDANSNADTGGYFQDVNAGKLSLTLNLALPEGRKLLRSLVAVSDAIVCNLHGDQLQRWGVGYEDASRINPRIIVLTVPTMETKGPRARWRGFGDSFAAMSGLKSVSGLPGEPPVNFGHQYPDFSSNPFHAAIALMAALHRREQTGRGQFIEVSQYESTAALLGPAVLEYTANGVTPRPRGNFNHNAAPHNIYRCRGEDSWCAITVLEDAQWRALVTIDALRALDRPEFATLEGRRAGEDDIDAGIEAWTCGWDRQELAAFLQSRGVPAGSYQDIVDMVHNDPVLGERYFEKRMHPVGREFLVHGSPIQSRRTPAQVELGPLLGEHTIQILEGIIGLTADEIAEYAAVGAIE